MPGTADFFGDPHLSDVQLGSTAFREIIPAHKVILSGGSEYFKGVFQFSEKTGKSRKEKLNLPGELVPRYDILKVCIAWIYGMDARDEMIGPENDWELFHLADYLLMTDLATKCIQSYTGRIDINAGEHMALIRSLAYPHFKMALESFWAQHLDEIPKGDIMKLPQENFKNIMTMGGIQISTEYQLWQIIIEWLKKNNMPKETQQEILSHPNAVRYGMMTSRQFKEVLVGLGSTLKHEHWQMLAFHVWKTGVTCSEEFPMDILGDHQLWAKPRLSSKVVLMTGGFTNQITSKALQVYDPRHNYYFETSENLTKGLAYHGSVYTLKKLYLIGGYSGTIGPTYLNTVPILGTGNHDMERGTSK